MALRPQLWVALVLACTALASAATAAASGGKLLALLQDLEQQQQLSKFFGALEKAGVAIDYKQAKDASIKLRDYDTWHYDHLAIFAPKAESAWGTWGWGRARARGGSRSLLAGVALPACGKRHKGQTEVALQLGAGGQVQRRP